MSGQSGKGCGAITPVTARYSPGTRVAGRQVGGEESATVVQVYAEV